MKPAPFDYARPDTLEEVTEILQKYGDEARIIAGGQSLMPMMNMRLVRPEVVVDIAGVNEFQGVSAGNRSVEVGALVTQAELEEWPELNEKLLVVGQAIPHIGHFQTRNRGTVCGSICHADPSSELPLCLALLGGEVELASRQGRRRVIADDFQISTLTTAKEANEVVTKAVFPCAKKGDRFSFTEFYHRHGDFAVVAVAAMRRENTIRLAIGGVADRPEVREWSQLEMNEIDDALNDFAWDLGGSDDIHATAQYRRELVRHLGRKVIEDVAQ
jgi:2-furoyl-CoA dehydrogenase FAD binding subunit